MLARVLFGARVSLAVGLLSAAVAGGSSASPSAPPRVTPAAVVDTVLMRGTDAMLSVPRLPAADGRRGVLQPSIPPLVVLVGLVGWMETARVTAPAIAGPRERDSCMRPPAAGHLRIVSGILLPNAPAGDRVVDHARGGRGILLESALSFFGVGVQPPPIGSSRIGLSRFAALGLMITSRWFSSTTCDSPPRPR